MQSRWKGAAALAAIGAAVAGAALGLRARSGKRKGATKLPPPSGGGTSTAGPLRQTVTVDPPIVPAAAEHDSPASEDVPRYPTLSDEFRALSNGKKILAYFGFLDVEVFKNSAALFPEEMGEEAEILGH